MSAPTSDTEQPLTPPSLTHPPAADRRGRGDGSGDESSSLTRQLDVIPEMLSTLDTLTTAGQHHIMSKVVTFLEQQTASACCHLSDGNQRAFSELLGHLTRESERSLPDVRAFSRRAEGLMALLAAIA